MDVTIEQVTKMRGSLRIPGDKSIAHRSLMLGALARGSQLIRGLPASADVASTVRCLRSLGYPIDEKPDGVVIVPDHPSCAGGELDAGNSGTSARLLAGLAAGRGFACSIRGDDSLQRRPMNRIIEPLERMGADIRSSPNGLLPLFIGPAPLRGIDYRLPVASAQVKSAILLAGLGAEGATTVRENIPSRDHTEVMLRAMGVDVDLETKTGELAITVSGGAELQAVEITIPGDISSAAFFLAAAAILPDAKIRLTGVGINPTRTGALIALREMGADILIESEATTGGEAIADLIVRGGALRGIEIGGAMIPRLIDELPVLAVVASQAEGRTVVRDAGELRHKESDRIATTVENLTRMGADIEATEDGFVINGPSRLAGAQVDSNGDHRIAMAMAVAGMVAKGETVIRDSGAVGISYPDFFSDLRTLTVF